VCLVLLLGPLVPAVCLAQGNGEPDAGAAVSPQDRERARERFERGARAYEAGRYREAVDSFLEAARFAPNPAFSYNVGLAYEASGDVAQALRWYRDYLRRLPHATDRAEVERSVRRLEEQLQQRGVQQITITSVPEGATVQLDRRSVGITPWTGETRPGRHRLVLQLRGHADGVVEFTLAEDRSLDVGVTLNPGQSSLPAATAPTPSARPAAGPPPVPLPEPERHAEPRVSALTWLTLGTGAASLGAALGFELLRAQAEDDAVRAPTQVAAADRLDSIESRRTAARVLGGAGLVLTLTGGLLLAIDLTSGTRSASRGVSLGCDADGCAAMARGVF
jgi:tetratricopeptide (TPR) repeat protein